MLPFGVLAHATNVTAAPRPPAAYGNLPLYFETNHGQAESGVRFLARGQGYSFLLSPSEAAIALRPSNPAGTASSRHRADRSHASKAATRLIRMQFAGANPQPAMKGLEELAGKINYLLGSDERAWLRGLCTFAKVQYQQLYPGVDLVCYGNQRQLEYDFIVAPGADPSSICLHFEGVERLEIEERGDLLLHSGDAQFRQHKPLLYQSLDGARKLIAGGYALKENNTVVFEVGPFDGAKPLIIDPILGYSTYLGGTQRDIGWDIAVDAAGNAYVAGETISLLPKLITPGAFQRNYGGGFSDHTNEIGGDAFVAKLDPTGSSLVYLTYLGGSGDDAALGIAVDAAGNACLTGFTDSANFPTHNALQSKLGGIPDSFFGLFPTAGFVAQLDSAGSSLLYSTYLTGQGANEGIDIAVDSLGQLYVTGFTSSTNFPITTNAFQRFLNTRNQNVGPSFNSDAFVAKIDPTRSGRSSLIYSTYLGSFNADQGEGIAVDAEGNAYVTGLMDLLGQRNAVGATLFDAFVVKVDPTGSSLLYGQLLHGSGNDIPFRVALDGSGSAYITGSTSSTDFPATPNALNQGGVFKSTDAGASWSLSSAGLTRTFVRSLAIDPTAPSVVYAGTFGGVFQSMDAGADWSSSANGLGFAASVVSVTNGVTFTNQVNRWTNSHNALGFHPVISIVIDPAQPSTIYAATIGGGIHRSTNGGADWRPLVATNGISVDPNVFAILVDPVIPTRLYAGAGTGFFTSANGGATWNTANAGLANLTVRALAISTNGSVLYAGTAGGVAKSSNRGATWTTVNSGLANHIVNTIVLDPAAPNIVYAGTSGGVFKTVNGGASWTPVNSGLGSLVINTLALTPSAPEILYAATPNRLFKTSDGGASWLPLTNGLTTTRFLCVAVDPVSPDVLYAGARATNSPAGVNCFVSKISAEGATLNYSTVLGGNGKDEGWDIAVDPAGNAYVTGGTTSTNFPVIAATAPSPKQTHNSGASDAFVFELDPSGSALLSSFYLGGGGNDFGYGIGLDSAGNTYIAGRTTSHNFPTTGPIQPAFAGGADDAFVAKIIAQPALQIARSGNNLLLSWPAPTPEFILQVNHNGMHGDDWSVVPETPTVIKGRNMLTLGVAGGHETFRLKRQ